MTGLAAAARRAATALAERVRASGRRARDVVRVLHTNGQVPRHFRIVPYIGHGTGDRFVVRGRVVDSDDPVAAIAGETTGAAVRRTVSRFLTRGLPGVPLRVSIGGAAVETSTDPWGYFDLTIAPACSPGDGPWTTAEVELAHPYRGVTGRHTIDVQIRVPDPGSTFGVISDIDDTVLVTGVQRVGEMVARTLTGSFLTRTPMPGAPGLYRALAAGRTGRNGNPVFYVSSSPWHLHGFLTSFLAHRDFPAGPLLLRDPRTTERRPGHGSAKHRHIAEILDLHAGLPFILLGDSGQDDPAIYADVVRAFPGRVLAVYIREVRLDPGDGRVETVTDAWDDDTPFVLAADSDAIAGHAAQLGLIPTGSTRPVVEG